MTYATPAHWRRLPGESEAQFMDRRHAAYMEEAEETARRIMAWRAAGEHFPPSRSALGASVQDIANGAKG